MAPKISILVVSDNHGPLSKIHALLQKKHYDYVLHAGDFCCDPYKLKQIHPKTYFVLGNNDGYNASDEDVEQPEVQAHHHENLIIFQVGQWNFGITHSHYLYAWSSEKMYQKLFTLAQKHQLKCLISGHTHIPHLVEKYGIILVNPGSIEEPRGLNHTKSYAEIVIDADQKIHVQHFAYDK